MVWIVLATYMTTDGVSDTCVETSVDTLIGRLFGCGDLGIDDVGDTGDVGETKGER